MAWRTDKKPPQWEFVSNINPANIALEYTLFRTGGTPVSMPPNTDPIVWGHIQTKVMGTPEERLLTKDTESKRLS